VACRKVSQEAKVLTATVTLKPGQHNQWDVKCYIFKQFRPIVHILLQSIDSDLHLGVGFFLASNLSPQALDRNFVLNNVLFVLCEVFYFALEIPDCLLDSLDAATAVFHSHQVLNFDLNPPVHHPVGITVFVFTNVILDHGLIQFLVNKAAI